MLRDSQKMWRENYTPYEAETWHEYALNSKLCIDPTFKTVNYIHQCEMSATPKLTFHMT